MSANISVDRQPRTVQPTPTYNRRQGDKLDSLGQAKDRAQLTATTSMSVVQVALLKEVLVLGPDNNRYYLPTLCLICISLALQIAAGAISLAVNHIRVYYSEYKEDAAEDFWRNACCSVRIPAQTSKDDSGSAVGNIGFVEEDHAHSNGPRSDDTSGANTNAESREFHFHMAELELHSEHVSPGCCPCEITPRIFDDYEYAVLDAYDEWTAEYIGVELKAAEANVRIRYLVENIKTIKDEISQRGESKGLHTEEDFKNKMATLNLRQDETLQKIAEAEHYLVKERVGRARGDVLAERAKATRRKQVLKRSTFWQHTLNFIFYACFVLNAFIAGLGLTAGGTEEGSLINKAVFVNSTLSILPVQNITLVNTI